METVFIDEMNNINELNLVVSTSLEINIYNKYINKINIKVLDNVNININDYNENSKNDTDILLTLGTNSKINYNLSNIVKDKKTMNLNINYQGNNSECNVNIHSLVSGNEEIKLTGKITNEFKNNTLVENVKVILEDKGTCQVDPDMMIDTKLVNANHLVAVSNIRKDELFYLMSKGISEERAKQIIKKSFLISNIKNEKLKEKISNI